MWKPIVSVFKHMDKSRTLFYDLPAEMSIDVSYVTRTSQLIKEKFNYIYFLSIDMLSTKWCKYDVIHADIVFLMVHFQWIWIENNLQKTKIKKHKK